MRRLIVSVFLMLLVPLLLSAQDARESWDNLKQLQVGQKIEVVDVNLKSVKGTFASFSEEAITLATKEGEMVVRRDRTYRVSVPGGKRGRNALIGLAIGAGAGLAVGAAYMGAEAEAVQAAGASAPAIGAGIGAAIGAVFCGSRTIYRAPRRELPAAP